jgi:prepilin-type N-terminal cleavage/methylation domain-containing protein
MSVLRAYYQQRNPTRLRRSFTLIELLISIAIIALLAATALFTLFGALEAAKESRTRAQIARLHELMMSKWETYLARPIRRPIAFGTKPTDASTIRLAAIRELLRLELPDRITDVHDVPVTGLSPPPLYLSYRRLVCSALGWPAPPTPQPPTPTAPLGWYQASQPNDGAVGPGIWSYTHQGSECLYLILSVMRDEDSSALDFFVPEEIGDTDNDGMFEILDAWGRPIEFMRWAPGFATLPGPDGAWGKFNVNDDGVGPLDDDGEMGWPGSDDVTELQSRDTVNAPDPFDPLKVDTRPNFALYPLLVSAGKDGSYGIEMEIDMNTNNNTPTPTQDLFHYSTTPTWFNDPYYFNSVAYLGRPVAVTAGDNITNHAIDAE